MRVDMTNQPKDESSAEEKLDAFVEDKKHIYDCAAHDEGQFCCLERGKNGRNFISELIAAAKQEAFRAGEVAGVKKVMSLMDNPCREGCCCKVSAEECWWTTTNIVYAAAQAELKKLKGE